MAKDVASDGEEGSKGLDRDVVARADELDAMGKG